MKRLPILFSVALFCLLIFSLVISDVLASPIYFSDRSSFNAAIAGVLDFESFESSFPAAATASFGDFSFSETDVIPGYNWVYWTTASEYPGFVTDGSAAMFFSDNYPSVGTFQFNNPINAFGVDVALYTVAASNTIYVGGDLDSTISLMGSAFYKSAFFGAIDFSGTFDTITFNASGTPVVGFDSVSYGMTTPVSYEMTTPVPEPATMLLLGSGLAGLAAFRRRFRK